MRPGFMNSVLYAVLTAFVFLSHQAVAGSLDIDEKLQKELLQTYKDRGPDYEPRTEHFKDCLLYTSPSPRDKRQSRMPSSA